MLLRFGFVTVLLSLAAAGCHRIGNCEPHDVNGLKTGCSGPSGYMWNGSSCVYTQACNCSGADCQGLYQTRDHCETAHTHCVK